MCLPIADNVLSFVLEFVGIVEYRAADASAILRCVVDAGMVCRVFLLS